MRRHHGKRRTAGSSAARRAAADSFSWRVLGSCWDLLRILTGEAERRGVDAVTQAARLGTVVENMTQVRAAIGAIDLGAHHAETAIGVGAHAITCQRQPETRPAGTGVVFVLGVEEFGAAHDAAVRALLLVVRVRTGKGAFGAPFLRNVVLLRSEALAEVGIRRLGVSH